MFSRFLMVIAGMFIYGSMIILTACISENKADKIVYVTNVEVDEAVNLTKEGGE